MSSFSPFSPRRGGNHSPSGRNKNDRSGKWVTKPPQRKERKSVTVSAPRIFRAPENRPAPYVLDFKKMGIYRKHVSEVLGSGFPNYWESDDNHIHRQQTATLISTTVTPDHRLGQYIDSGIGSHPSSSTAYGSTADMSMDTTGTSPAEYGGRDYGNYQTGRSAGPTSGPFQFRAQYALSRSGATTSTSANVMLQYQYRSGRFAAGQQQPDESPITQANSTPQSHNWTSTYTDTGTASDTTATQSVSSVSGYQRSGLSTGTTGPPFYTPVQSVSSPYFTGQPNFSAQSVTPASGVSSGSGQTGESPISCARVSQSHYRPDRRSEYSKSMANQLNSLQLQ